MINTQIKTVLVITTITIACSCKIIKNEHKECKDLKISPDKSNTVSLAKLSNNISFIKLQTSSNNLIKNVYKYYEYDNQIYFGDYDQKAVFVFNKNGLFINKIGKYGKGPAETVELSDFIVDKEHKELVVWDNGLKKRIIYNLEGDFLKEEKIELVSRNFIKLGTDKYALYGGLTSDFDLYITKNGDIIDSFIPVLEDMIYLPVILNMEYFHQYEDESITLLPCLSDIVYELQENGVIEKYRIKFGKNSMPSNYLSDKVSNKKGKKTKPEAIYKLFYEELPKSNYAYKPHSFKESSSHIYLEYIYKNREHYAIINKANGNVEDIKYWSLDKDNLINLRTINFFEIKEKFLVGFIHTYELLDNFNKLSKENQKAILLDFPELKPIIAGSKIGDNPILIKIELKTI